MLDYLLTLWEIVPQILNFWQLGDLQFHLQVDGNLVFALFVAWQIVRRLF